MATRELQAAGSVQRDQLARLVELLGTYSSTVLINRQLEKITGGELTPAQLEALAFINRHGGCSAKALSEGLHISIPSSTRLVDRLVRKRLVDRRESGEDRRLVHLTLTETGQTALDLVQEARIDQLRQALAIFPPAERLTLLGLLERLLRAALRDEQTVDDCCRHCGTEHDQDCVVNEAHLALLGRPIERP